MQQVHNQFNYRCAITGDKNDLQAHHIRGWGYAPGRYDPHNGILLNKKIHSEFHAECGDKNLTLAHLKQFIKERYDKHLMLDWEEGNHQPISASEIEERIQSQRDKKNQEFKRLKFVDGDYKNVHSKVIIKCPKHDRTQTTTVHNYTKCKAGLKCCGHQGQIDSAKNRHRNVDGTFK